MTSEIPTKGDGLMEIEKFIRQEVRNQGFDLSKREGRLRVLWMHWAWDYARGRAAESGIHWKPTLIDMLVVGRFVEQVKNMAGARTVNVSVGYRICPDHGDVGYLLRLLEIAIPSLAPLEFYRAFEIIHPFVDGNGRAGKVLLCWLNCTLDDPEMPPDLFGGGVP